MDIRIQAVNFNAEDDLIQFVTKKMEKLPHFYERIVSADVFLHVENTADDANKHAEVKLAVPGPDIIVKKAGSSFESAVDIALDVLVRQLKKHKEKERSM
jgi:putative sigma-54 modulation protein